jgi:glutathione S-transferase
MKLYYSPGACSLSPHIVLRESGLKFDLVLAPTKTHQLPDGTSYYNVNSKGYVPLLELDDGTRITEGPVIVQYIADQVPAKKLAPAAGTLERYRLMEWLNFITAEVHKQFGALFVPGMPDDAKKLFLEKIGKRLDWVDAQLEGREFLVGKDFTGADAYLYTVTNWAQPMGVDLSTRKHLQAWRARIAARPTVQEAEKIENANRK